VAVNSDYLTMKNDFPRSPASRRLSPAAQDTRWTGPEAYCPATSLERFSNFGRCFRKDDTDIACVRNIAKEAGPFAVALIDALTPRLRRAQVTAARRQVEPPPLP
jgi:hypothetical protein